MHLFRQFFWMAIASIVLTLCTSLPVQAASSAAIRVHDEIPTDTKNYTGQDLSQTEFGAAQLAGANFTQANLRGAVFNSANLRNANLHGVDLSDGIAYLTDLSGADLSDAILTSAMLLKSDFRGATITGTDFSFAVLAREQLQQLCETASGTNSVTGIETRESLGCSD